MKFLILSTVTTTLYLAFSSFFIFSISTPKIIPTFKTIIENLPKKIISLCLIILLIVFQPFSLLPNDRSERRNNKQRIFKTPSAGQTKIYFTQDWLTDRARERGIRLFIEISLMPIGCTRTVFGPPLGYHSQR